MLALLDLDEARILARRDGPGDADAARRLLARARERSGSLGVPVIGDQLDARRGGCRAPARGAGRAARAAPAAAPAHRRALRREGDVWRVEYEGRTRFVKDAKGLRHLALLLDNPGVEFHAVDLVGAAEGTTPARRGPTRGGDGDVAVRRGRRRRRRAARRRRPSASTARASRTCAPTSRRPSRSTTPSARPRAREEIGVHRARAVERGRPRRARPAARRRTPSAPG
jgi:hypothetical protein